MKYQRTMRPLFIAMGLSWAVMAGSAQEMVLETDYSRFVLAADGCSKSLGEIRTAHDWLAPAKRAFATVMKGGKSYPATGLRREGQLWRAEFGASGVQVDFSLAARSNYVVFELVRLHGEGVDEVRFAECQVTCRENAAGWLGAWWNESFAVSVLGLSDCVNVQLLGNGVLAASVYPEFGMEGQRVVLVATPTPQFLDVVQRVERDFKLPSPQLDGQWAKRSRAVRTSYLFTDLTAANADETIRFAKLGGFKYIMLYEFTWSTSLGSYPINTNNFPQGEQSLKAVVDKCHAAGLKVGLHCLTSFVGKNDSLVKPRPDPRLLKDDQTTLLADLDEKDVEITAAGPLGSFPTEGAFYGDAKAGFDIQIDDELIQYRAIGGPATNKFINCVRGFVGTRAARHKAGSKISHLVERYGCYLADLRTTLKGDISKRLAGIINRCGFDMVYFDGGECNMANGPFWYWVSQQQEDVCRRVTRELLVQGSGGTAWTWHWFARGCCDDFAAVAPKQYLDYHKIADSWTYYTQNFMPADLGWWGFLADEPHQPATTPDEVEYYAVRMLALDTPVSLETRLDALKRNGRTEEMLKLLGEYEQLRLSGAVPKAARDQLRTGEWHLRREGPNRVFVPIRYEAQRASVPGELRVTNSFGAQPLQFRLQAAPALAPVGAPTNIVLFRADPAMDLQRPTAKAPMPGALAGQTNFAQPLHLLRHRALAVQLRVDGPPVANELSAVLNVQLEAAGKTYRDHYIDLNFTGEKTIILPEPTTARMLPEFRPAQVNYAFKAAMYAFDYQHIVALNLRWMRLPKDQAIPCALVLVEALAECDVALRNPRVAIGDTVITIPAELQTGHYAEFWGDGSLRIFNCHGTLLSSAPVLGAKPTLPMGESRLLVRGGGAASVKFTAITTGDPLRW